MQFVHPSFLFFLFAAIVPIIVHLFKFQRYKREYFSNVRLLQEIRTEQRRRAKLREWLVLVARILTIVCLVLAFAQPYIPGSDRILSGGSGTKVSIYLDNSFSMQAPARQAILLDRAREEAGKILRSLPPDAAVQLLTNEFRGEDQRFGTPAEIAESLSEVGFCPITRNFDRIKYRQAALFDEHSVAPSDRLCYYISDFQKSTFPLSLNRVEEDTQTRRVFVPVSGVDYSNISLDSLCLTTPVLQAGREIVLRAFLSNRSDREQWQVPLRLFVRNRQLGVFPVDFAPGEQVEIQMPLRLETSGFYQGYAEIADYPVEFDNRLYFSLHVADKLPVLHLYDRTYDASVSRIFARDSAFDYLPVSVRNIDYSRLSSSRLIIAEGLREIPSALVGELDKFVRDGGSLLLIPEAPERQNGEYVPALPAADLTTALIGRNYGPFRNERSTVKRINSNHPFFSMAIAADPETSSAVYPEVKGYYPLPTPDRVSYRDLMSFSVAGPGTGEDFMRMYSSGKGLLYLVASPIGEEFTDFARHYTFVVSLLNMALYQNGSQELYYTTGSSEGLYFPSALFAGMPENTVYKIVSEDYSFSLIPSVRRIGSETVFFPYGEISEAGNYYLVAERTRTAVAQDSAGTTGKQWPLSFNYDRLESEKACYDEPAIREWTAKSGLRVYHVLNPDRIDLSKGAVQTGGGPEFWKVFLIFALAFLVLETLFLRGWNGKSLSFEKRKKKE